MALAEGVERDIVRYSIRSANDAIVLREQGGAKRRPCRDSLHESVESVGSVHPIRDGHDLRRGKRVKGARQALEDDFAELHGRMVQVMLVYEADCLPLTPRSLASGRQKVGISA